MSELSSVLEAISVLLDYPRRGLQERIGECDQRVTLIHPGAADKVREFGGRIDGKPLAELEELYIKTFDMNPTCTLDLGWQLFGEDYNRGLFLVKVRQEMQRLGVSETHELPDHLTQILRVLSRLEPDRGRDFAVSCVLPAIQKTCAAINEDCPYRLLVEAVVELLAALYQVSLEEASDGALV